MESTVPEASKKEAIQLVEEHLLALKKKIEELSQIEKELSREIALLKAPQSQTKTQILTTSVSQAMVETKQDEEERYVLDPKTGSIEKRKTKKAVYLEAKP